MNKKVFKKKTASVKRANTRNEAGGLAYKRSSKEALAQLAVTGCFNDTYYASAGSQLSEVKKHLSNVDLEFVAKLAVYARTSAYMKDMPAYLVVSLASHKTDKSRELLEKVFPQVIDTPKMLRNFIEVAISGVAGRVWITGQVKRLVNRKLTLMSDNQLFRGDTGEPSMGRILRLAHTKPMTSQRRSLHAFMRGELTYTTDGKFYITRHKGPGKWDEVVVPKKDIPELLMNYMMFKAGDTDRVPDLPFMRLTDMKLTESQWREIARNTPWMGTRMNLNTFQRHGVYKDAVSVKAAADKLRNPELIRKSRCFPYQLMTAYQHISSSLPSQLADALQDAMEIAVENVPKIKGHVVVAPDVSGSMRWNSVTGTRRGSTSKTTCLDVAALFATVVARRSEEVTILPVDTHIHATGRWNPRDSIMTNAAKLAKFGGGGTNLSLVLDHILRNKMRPDAVIIISDSESWEFGDGTGTAMAQLWNEYKDIKSDAKLINIDIQPYTTKQAATVKDVLSVGGFGDQVFDVVTDFLSNSSDPDLWVHRIESIEI